MPLGPHPEVIDFRFTIPETGIANYIIGLNR
jgi:hypothetical protein